MIGHSYGSTTVADASKDRMRPTNVVLIGSPGPDHAHHAKEFGIGASDVRGRSLTRCGHLGSRRHRRAARRFARTGTDPALEDFGAVRFEAEATDRDTNN